MGDQWTRLEEWARAMGESHQADTRHIAGEVLSCIEAARVAPLAGQPLPATTPRPTAEPIMRYFDYAHLPERLRAVSSAFHNLAWWLEKTLPEHPERTVALRKLLEAKDAAVRARL